MGRLLSLYFFRRHKNCSFIFISLMLKGQSFIPLLAIKVWKTRKENSQIFYFANILWRKLNLLKKHKKLILWKLAYAVSFFLKICSKFFLFVDFMSFALDSSILLCLFQIGDNMYLQCKRRCNFIWRTKWKTFSKEVILKFQIFKNIL